MSEASDSIKGRKLLLHCCCGPCAEAPLQDLLAQGYSPSLYYFNPNIQPEQEWLRRLAALRQLSTLLQLELNAVPVHDTELWTAFPGEKAERCQFCYACRLEATAYQAAQAAIPYFSTSLLVSPYQDRERILTAGLEAAARWQVEFVAPDWRPLFRAGQELAQSHGLYRQKYCGCLPSLDESKFAAKIKAQQQEFPLAPELTFSSLHTWLQTRQHT